MKRAITPSIQTDLPRKIVLLSGPRQTGKTTLARMLTHDHDYLNYDYAEHRLRLKEKSWDRERSLIVFDELHKMKRWKAWLKGVFDVEGIPPQYIVTGSARLDAIRKTGDSLAGRYFRYRLHPFDVKEVRDAIEPDQALDRLLSVGGFPEPFLENSQAFYRRWQKTHTDIILRQDLIDTEGVREILGMETLIQLLQSRVGSPVSYASLGRDLDRDANTVKRWLSHLENLFVVFPIRPLVRNVGRAILKQPKYYFYDTARVLGDEGVRLENAVACALLKECHALEDCYGFDIRLNYLRTKDGREIDFAVQIDGRVCWLIEVKQSDAHPSRSFGTFRKVFPNAGEIQLVKQLKDEKTFLHGPEVRKASQWLARFSFGQAAETG